MIQPPKISPLGLQSAGIAKVRDASSPLGWVKFGRIRTPTGFAAVWHNNGVRGDRAQFALLRPPLLI
jgi:hypothetical protein